MVKRFVVARQEGFEPPTLWFVGKNPDVLGKYGLEKSHNKAVSAWRIIVRKPRKDRFTNIGVTKV